MNKKTIQTKMVVCLAFASIFAMTSAFAGEYNKEQQKA